MKYIFSYSLLFFSLIIKAQDVPQTDSTGAGTEVDSAVSTEDVPPAAGILNASPAAAPQEAVLADTIPLTDGFFQANTALEGAVPFQYPKINRNNIRFYKRVWRDIDLNDKQNQLLAVPGSSLIEAIMKDIASGKLTPYEPTDDGFKQKLTAREGAGRFQDSVLVPVFDADGNQIDSKMVLNDFDPAKVTKFRIKEDIFLDKQRGRVETRIIGVAPMMNVTTSDSSAQSIGATPAFWLYFPQLRYTLVKMDVSDPERDLFEMTMDDIFVQRKFSSRIVRETSSSKSGVAGEEGLDAEKMEQKIREFKNNIWKNPDGVTIVNSEKLKKEKE